MIRLAPLLAILLIAAHPGHAAGYDAIAIDDDQNGARGNGDTAVGQGPTEAEARRIAMSNCTSGGNVACTIKLTYRQCGAYAASPSSAGKAMAATMQAATDAALKACGTRSCKLVVADCVDTPLQPQGTAAAPR